MDVGFEVEWLCSFVMAPTSGGGASRQAASMDLRIFFPVSV